MTRPLISLIAAWNDDELVVDLVSGLQVSAELAEWVVAAVRPGEALCELHRQGIIRLISRRSGHRHGGFVAWASGVPHCLTVGSSVCFTLASILTHCIDGIIAAFGDLQIAPLAPMRLRERLNKFLWSMF